MPDPDFFIKQGDTLPPIARTLEDAAGDPVNITGGTVVFKMKPIGGGTIVYGGTATITNGTIGAVSYDWQTADTETSGLYLAEWDLSLSGDTETFPNGGFDLILVTPSLDA